MNKITLDDLMTFTRNADDARRAMELSEKEIGQAQRRAAKKATAHEEAIRILNEAKAKFEAQLVAKK